MRNLQTRDLFAAIRLVSMVDAREDINQLVNNNAGRSLEQIGFDVFYAIVSKCGSKGVENAFYEFVSGPLEVTPEDVANMGIMELFDKMYEVANPNEWADFFKRVRALNTKQ